MYFGDSFVFHSFLSLVSESITQEEINKLQNNLVPYQTDWKSAQQIMREIFYLIKAVPIAEFMIKMCFEYYHVSKNCIEQNFLEFTILS